MIPKKIKKIYIKRFISTTLMRMVLICRTENTLTLAKYGTTRAKSQSVMNICLAKITMGLASICGAGKKIVGTYLLASLRCADGHTSVTCCPSSSEIPNN